MARLSVLENTEMVDLPKALANLSTNWAQRSSTLDDVTTVTTIPNQQTNGNE